MRNRVLVLGAVCSAIVYTLYSSVATHPTENGPTEDGAVKECRHIQHNSWLRSWSSVPSDDQDRWKTLKVGSE